MDGERRRGSVPAEGPSIQFANTPEPGSGAIRLLIKGGTTERSCRSVPFVSSVGDKVYNWSESQCVKSYHEVFERLPWSL